MAKTTVRWSETTAKERKKMIGDLAKELNVHDSLESLIATMHNFEQEYGMSTVDFYARFVAGKVGDSRDFIKWAGTFQVYHQLLQTHFAQDSKAA